MAKGNVILKTVGVLLIILGIATMLWTMKYGFFGAKFYMPQGKPVLTGLLIFYGFYGVLTGLFQIGVGALSFRHSKIAEHWTRCFVWGIVILALGILLTILLFMTCAQIPPRNIYYPEWYGKAIVIAGGIVLPVVMILGSILNKISKGSAVTAPVQAESTAA